MLNKILEMVRVNKDVDWTENDPAEEFAALEEHIKTARNRFRELIGRFKNNVNNLEMLKTAYTEDHPITSVFNTQIDSYNSVIKELEDIYNEE